MPLSSSATAMAQTQSQLRTPLLVKMMWLGVEMIFHTTVTLCYCKYSAIFCYMEVQHLYVKGKFQIVRTLCFIPKRKEMTSAFLSWIEKSPSSVNSIRLWLIIWTLSLFFTIYYFAQTTNSGQLYSLHIFQICIILSLALALTEYVTSLYFPWELTIS